MKSTERDVIVVGAGPGGSTCAAYLALAGVDVLLLDKEVWPRDKPCGDGQTAVACEFLKDIGIADELASMGFKTKGASFTSPDYNRVNFDMGEASSYVTPRRLFDDLVRKRAIQAGAEMIENAWVYDVIKEDGFIRGVKAKIDGEYVELRSKLVIGADGAHSIIAKKIGMFNDDDNEVAVVGRCYYEDVDIPGYLEMHLDKDVLPGYVWIFPMRDGKANVGLGYNRKFYVDVPDLEVTLEKWIVESPYGECLRGKRRIGEFRGWRIPYATGAFDNYVDGCMLIGDAGSLITPFTAEGIGPAMASGHLVSKICQKALRLGDFSCHVLMEYKVQWDNEYGPAIKRIKSIESAFQSAETINGYMAKFKGNPDAREMFLGMMHITD